MYKDKHLQKEANKRASQRRRDKKAVQGMTRLPIKGMTNEGMTESNSGTSVIPCDTPEVIPNKLTIQTLEKSERGEDLTEFDNAEDLLEDLHDTKPKRGKDIKVFADLAPDVQQTIISKTTDKHGKMDKMARANRTSIAINYQHLYPDRYYLTGAGAETPWERDGQETIG